MTEWTLLKRLLDAVHQHSTMIGRLWLTVMVIFRLLVVAVATEDVYADEQTMFVCNTLQPGCATVCYDAFAPISQPRFWVFHIISVSTPSLCFIVYTWHNLSKLPRGAPGGGAEPGEMGPREDGGGGGREAFERSCDSSDSCSVRSHRHLGHSLADVLEGGGGGGAQSPQGRGGDPGAATSLNRARARVRRGRRGTGGGVLSKYYVFHVWLRAVLEVGFVAAQWLLFGFEVPTRFLCAAVAPCGQPVDCYVSRPTEKTVFLLFMFCVGVLCILLNLLELNHLGWKKVRRVLRERGGSWVGGRPGKRRAGYETFAPSPDSPSPTSSSLGFRDVTSTASLPALDLVVEHRPDWTCAGNCSPFKGVPGAGVRPPKSQDHRMGERQPLKSKRDHKQRSTEVWI